MPDRHLTPSPVTSICSSSGTSDEKSPTLANAGPVRSSSLTRRRFLALAGSAAALASRDWSQSAAPQPVGATLSVDPETKLFTIPADFTGLSYESAQLANSAFFSAGNCELVGLFRALSPSGVLRIGGGTSEFTTYAEQAPATPPPFEIFGPDTSKTVKQGTITSALALRNLRAFLDATGWKCLYGLNLGQGTKENAAAEAEAAYRILGNRLLALQIGNEPDSFKRFRPQGYTPADYVREWLAFHAAIVNKVPQAKFAGPDISNKLPYLTAFAAEAPEHSDIILLTMHYYAMGPAGNPLATRDNLLSPSPRLTTFKWQNISVVHDAMQSAHLPCRISEANSCWNGGLEGVSDTFASALWCADMMLHFASLGISGVNLHGGGNGWYSPIVGSPTAGFTRRPEYFGIQLAQHFAGATLLRTTFECDNDRISVWAAHGSRGKHEDKLLALINKSVEPAEIAMKGTFAQAHWRAMRLSAPSLDAKEDIQFQAAHLPRSSRNSVRIEPHTALLLHT